MLPAMPPSRVTPLAGWSVVAAFVPIGLAAIAIVVALAAVTIIGQQWRFSFFVTNMVVT